MGSSSLRGCRCGRKGSGGPAVTGAMNGSRDSGCPAGMVKALRDSGQLVSRQDAFKVYHPIFVLDGLTPMAGAVLRCGGIAVDQLNRVLSRRGVLQESLDLLGRLSVTQELISALDS